MGGKRSAMKYDYLKIYAVVLAWFLWICAAPVSRGETNPSDVAAINNLYVALGSPVLPGWVTTGGDPCGEAWQGVVCNNTDIIRIVLNGANLGGELGDNLGLFVSIKTIDLSNNHIGGSIPSMLPATMQNFFLSANQFSGSIPSSLSSLILLTDMSLNDNHLSGEIPDAFQSLTGLINLDLSSNNLSGELPPSLESLSSLTTLHLQNNLLSGTLDVLQDLPLKDLNIENNQFFGTIPAKLLNIPNFRDQGNPFNTTTTAVPPSTSPLKPPPAGPAPPFFKGTPSERTPAKQADGPSAKDESNSGKTKKVLTTRQVVGISIAGVFLLVILALGLALLAPRFSRRREEVDGHSREHIYDLRSLENYTFVDEHGKDMGINIRHRAKSLIDFIQDDDKLREERKKAKKAKDKYIGVSSGSVLFPSRDSWSDTPRRSFDDYDESESSKPASKSKSGGFHDEDTSEPEDGDSEFNSYKSSNTNSQSNQQSGSCSKESSPTTITAPSTISKPSSESRPSRASGKSSEPSRKIDLGAAANYGKSQTSNNSNDSDLIGSIASNNETINETKEKSKDLLDDIFSGINDNSPSKPITTPTTPIAAADDFADFASFENCDGNTKTTSINQGKVVDEFADFTSFDGNTKVDTSSTITSATTSIQKESKGTDEFADFAFAFTPATSASTSLTTPSTGVTNTLLTNPLLNSSFDLKAQSKVPTVAPVASNVNNNPVLSSIDLLNSELTGINLFNNNSTTSGLVNNTNNGLLGGGVGAIGLNQSGTNNPLLNSINPFLTASTPSSNPATNASLQFPSSLPLLQPTPINSLSLTNPLINNIPGSVNKPTALSLTPTASNSNNTWSSYSSNVNINVDNLLAAKYEKHNAPSMNQLAANMGNINLIGSIQPNVSPVISPMSSVNPLANNSTMGLGGNSTIGPKFG